MVWFVIADYPLEIAMTSMTAARFLNGFFSPAVLGSLASFQLVERMLAWGSPRKGGDLRTSVENMRPVALYLGDMVGCVFIGLAAVLALPWLFFIVTISNLLMFACILFTIPDPIHDAIPELTTEAPNLQEGGGEDDREPLLAKTDEEEDDGDAGEPQNRTEAQGGRGGRKKKGPLNSPNWRLFTYYSWNRAVVFIFLANMMNSLFNSIVGTDQYIQLGMSELLLAAENLLGSLFGVALAWLFMTYFYQRLRSTRSLHLTGILSAASLAGMPWLILSIPLSFAISVAYTPIIITQDAVAIVSGANFATRTIHKSEG